MSNYAKSSINYAIWQHCSSYEKSTIMWIEVLISYARVAHVSNTWQAGNETRAKTRPLHLHTWRWSVVTTISSSFADDKLYGDSPFLLVPILQHSTILWSYCTFYSYSTVHSTFHSKEKRRVLHSCDHYHSTVYSTAILVTNSTLHSTDERDSYKPSSLSRQLPRL